MVASLPDLLDAVRHEPVPRETEEISGAEMYDNVLEYFGAEEVSIGDIPMDFYTGSLESDDVDRVVCASMAACLTYLALRDLSRSHPLAATHPGVDYAYHAFAALRIRLDAHFASLVGEDSPQRLRIN